MKADEEKARSEEVENYTCELCQTTLKGRNEIQGHIGSIGNFQQEVLKLQQNQIAESVTDEYYCGLCAVRVPLSKEDDTSVASIKKHLLEKKNINLLLKRESPQSVTFMSTDIPQAFPISHMF